MRIRTIKPEFFKHDRLGSLPPLARLLFVGLWCMADGEGRLEDRPTRIRVEILPYDDAANVEDLLKSLADGGHIVRYSAQDGSRLIAIPSWREHQRISGKEAQTPTRLPPPPYEVGINGEAAGKLEMPGKGREGKGKDGTRSTESGGEAARAASPQPAQFPIFDCVPGRKTGDRTWTLTDSHVADLVAAFPGVNVPVECRKAWNWARSNPAKRKTASGMPDFLHRWMTKEQNKVGPEQSNGARRQRGAADEELIQRAFTGANQ